MAYIPNADDPTEPVESQTVESAAQEFRTLKASTLRGLRFPAADAAINRGELPTAINRASKLLAFDASGVPTPGPTVASVTDQVVLATAAANAAAISAVAAEAALDTFDDIWLGAKAVEPVLDNDGDPLVTGALYFNIVTNYLYIYDGGWLVVSTSADAAAILAAREPYLLSRANHTGTQAISTVAGLQTALDSKQATLISGTNIKTVNGASLLGGGNLAVAVTPATAAEAAARVVTTPVITPANFSDANIVTGVLAPTTAGTAIDFTGIPSWAKRINLMFNTVSTNGTADLVIRLQGSGAVETAGYNGSAGYNGNAVPTGGVAHTTGFRLSAVSNIATYTYSGKITLELMDATTNLWCAMGLLTSTDGRLFPMSGTKALTGALTTVRLTTTGADTFDLGSINISWE